MTTRWMKLREAAKQLRKSEGALRRLIERHANGAASVTCAGIECRKFRGRWCVDLREWASRNWSTLSEVARIVGRSEDALRRCVERFVEKTDLEPEAGFELDSMFWRRFGARCWRVDLGTWATSTQPPVIP